MSLPQTIVLGIFWLVGIAALWYGLTLWQARLAFRRNSVLVLARQLPDHVQPLPFGGASLDAPIYLRQAAFLCPMTGKKRIVTERVASSEQSRWSVGRRIAVRVQMNPPHTAIVATFRNLYLFPATYVVVGIAFAVVIPFGLLTR